MDGTQGDRSAEELRLSAHIATLQGMISHLQDANVALQVERTNLENENASSREQLATANRRVRDLQSTNPGYLNVPYPAADSFSAERDQAFERWVNGGRRLPSLSQLRLEERVGDSKTVTLPSLRVNVPKRLPQAPQQETPRHSVQPEHPFVDEPQLNADDGSTLGSPQPSGTPHRSFSPIVKHEEPESNDVSAPAPEPPSAPSAKPKGARKGVTSTGRRAAKRKNPDLYTDDPPTPYGQRRSKRLRREVNYEEKGDQSVEELAREIWRQESESRTPDQVPDEVEDGLFVPAAASDESDADDDVDDAQSPPASDLNEPPSASPITEPPATTEGKPRYKQRLTHDEPRMAKGTAVQVKFRFTWKSDSVVVLYNEWYHGTPENPAIAELENKYKATWRNAPGKKNHAYANDWVSKRQKVIMALEYFAGKQNKEPLSLAAEWDTAIRGKMTILTHGIPAPTAFHRVKHTLTDPLVDFESWEEAYRAEMAKKKEEAAKKREEKATKNKEAKGSKTEQKK